MQVLSLVLALATTTQPALSTTSERSGFTKTGRYDEVIELCDAFQRAEPARVKCVTFGTTPEGRPMKALVLSDDGILDPDAARAKKRPVILAQGGIHAGEIDGKDAGFLVVRELLDGKLAKGVLSQVTFVFVPVFNIDGHERFSKNNRPNQRGPEEMGWRVTSQNLNLNRDYAKAEAPEMQAMLRLLTSWDPTMYLDLHVTDGAKFQHDVSVIIDPAEAGPAPLSSMAKAVRTEIIKRLNSPAGGNHKALDFYPSFESYDDPASGFARGVAPPRLSTPYWSQHNRMGVLVETHSWKDYKTRVKATHDVLAQVFTLALTQAQAWRDTELAVDNAIAKGAGDVVLDYENTDEKITIDFLGYKYVREPSPVSGAMRTIYDESKPEVWHLPMKPGVKPKTVVKAPAGYVVPAAYAAWVKQKLELHGIQSRELSTSMLLLDAQAFRATAVKFGEKPYEGRMTAKATGVWAPEKRAVEKGSLFVPTAQPLGRLVVHLFEPQAADSFVSWGFFNASFEQKEYMESYVAEEVAEKMLKDPAVREEFAKLLESDADFAKDPEKRLDFFYKRHPSWDERVNLYPVLKVDSTPPG
jgi:murein tripeptide amidase MpaA